MSWKASTLAVITQWMVKPSKHIYVQWNSTYSGGIWFVSCNNWPGSTHPVRALLWHIDLFLGMYANLQKVTVSKCGIHAMPILFICIIVLQIFSDYTFWTNICQISFPLLWWATVQSTIQDVNSKRQISHFSLQHACHQDRRGRLLRRDSSG